jgi:hypothetical protein
MECIYKPRNWIGYFIDITTMGAYSYHRQTEFINCLNTQYLERIQKLSAKSPEPVDRKCLS